VVYDNQGGERQMFEGNWTCSGCGVAITQLPFQPDPARVGGLVCRDCHKQRVANKPRNDGPKQMFEGSWTCAGCGTAITSLPFQPDPSRADQLKCRDCFRK
jgi:CxxC-x17-CxxC domain-containing protein